MFSIRDMTLLRSLKQIFYTIAINIQSLRDFSNNC